MTMPVDVVGLDLTYGPGLADRVADNTAKFDPTESDTLIIGRGFGTTTDIEQGPDGNLYVVSLTDSAIYRISRKPSLRTNGGIR
jgi:hypothetical protein